MFAIRINICSDVRVIFANGPEILGPFFTVCSMFCLPSACPELLCGTISQTLIPYQVDVSVILPVKVCCSLLLMFTWKHSQIPKNTLNSKHTSLSNHWKSMTLFRVIIKINLYSQHHNSFFCPFFCATRSPLMAYFQQFWLPV